MYDAMMHLTPSMKGKIMKPTIYISRDSAKRAVFDQWRAGTLDSQDRVQLKRMTVREDDHSLSRGFAVYLPKTRTYL